MGFEMTAKMSMKHNFSKQHIRTAAYFSKCAAEIESASIGTKISEDMCSQHRAYITGTILSSVAALESSINELYLEALDHNPHTLKGLDSVKLALLGQF